ncbi:hypothetical protein CBM2586_B10036 [Cupriavidus phytorum]|uniref:Uncharacterized protein n=1 Tax=Cupriavidus taiwanensis TaxID=164546 RepID=A0A975XBM8_9BURK|nr:hypothetical protein CBM2586_B10036 [Cupriavidus taiwanensis]
MPHRPSYTHRNTIGYLINFW